MTYQTLTFDVADQMATIALNRPESANSLNPQMAKELIDVSIQCDDRPDIRAVVLTGEGRMFCAGGDLAAFADSGDGVNSLIKSMAGDLHMAISRFSRMQAPVIAAVNGIAAGAGFSMAIAADLVIASESAKFVLAYTNAGLAPDGSSTYFLPRRIGDRRARELMLTNRMLDAKEALEWGLVNEVVKDEALSDSAQSLAKRLSTGPTQAFGAVKYLLNASFDNGLETQMELEARAIAEMSVTKDGQEGIKAFLEKRAPKFIGG